MSEATPKTPCAMNVSPDDARVIDALFEHGPVRVSGGESDAGQVSDAGDVYGVDGEGDGEVDDVRADRVLACMGLLNHDTVELPGNDLVSGTIARLEQVRQREQFVEQVNVLAHDGEVLAGRSFNWRQATAIAAMIMIGMSVLWPVLTRTRVDARRMASANNLSMAGYGFGLYAADHNDVMPKRDAEPGAEWWRIGTQPNEVGQVRSNSAHLFILIRKKYVDPIALSCPSNPQANRGLDVNGYDWPDAQSVSFSYQNQFGPATLRLSRQPQMAVLANRNPMFQIRITSSSTSANGSSIEPSNSLRMASKLQSGSPSGSQPVFVFRRHLKPLTGSSAYQGRGQNVLLADGRVLWTQQPILRNGDNIWLVRGIDDYAGNEVPEQADDTFLVP